MLTPGPWRGVLATQGQEIPFLFEVKTEAGKPVVYLINKGLDGEERLRCEEISSAGDSTTIRLHTFDAALVVRADGKDKLKGTWVKYDTKDPYRVPLTATAGKQNPQVQMEGGKELFNQDDGSAGKVLPIFNKAMIKGANYKVTFRRSEGNTYPAVGVFKYNVKDNGTENNLTGKFLTETGDYRYLAGNIVLRNKVQHWLLSTFNGNNAFLFDAVPDKERTSSLRGDFYSGKSGHETWTAVLDPTAKRPSTSKGFR
ncbi:hypothetical protein [Hymenobacter sp. IS2118]|uniref:hypothetical protein n=1 Tax=Hymenobacter sp. IS2118 TaxID=1505605 RepID=UPI0012678585|nr:hypothetical protein [Hymenobacter sp. IS2118]